MAAANETLDLPSFEQRQSTFEQSVAISLHLWPTLTLAVQNRWGGPDSEDKRDWFAGAVVELFPEILAPSQAASQPKPPEEPLVEDVESRLLQVMMDEFGANVDDDSSVEIAGQIMRLRLQCLAGDFTEAEQLRQRWESRRTHGGSAGVERMFKQAEDADQDTDWESDDSGSDEEPDVEMDEAPPLVATRKEKTPPEVDEDGFQKVTRKKR